MNRTNNQFGVDIKSLAKEHNLSYQCLYERLRKGWSLENALKTSGGKRGRPLVKRDMRLF